MKSPVVIVPPNSQLKVENQTVTTKRLSAPVSGDTAKIKISGFKITGLSVRIKADVSTLLAKYIGNDRSFDDLESAAEVLQTAIRQEGLFLAQVDIPEQKLSDGVIELRVLEGRLDTVELAPLPEGLLVKREQVEAILARLEPGDLLTVDRIERVLFLLSDLRGINVSSVISAGSKPGTAKLGVTLKPGERSEKSADIDNYGSVYTGRYRLSGAYGINSPFGRGDLFKLTANVSTTAGMEFVRGAYQSPVGGSGLKLGTALSLLKYKLGTASFVPLQAHGQAAVVSFFSLYPVIRNRNFNTFSQVNYDRRQFRDMQDALSVDNKKHADVLNLGLVGDSRDQFIGGGVNNFSLGLTAGKITLDSAVLLASDQAGTGRKINGGFAKVNYSLGRQQLLWAKADNTANRLVVYASFQGQVASKNLDNSEKFSLGGPAGIRGYAGGEATGDSGNMLSWELRKNIIGESIKGDLVVSTFGDYGRVKLNHTALPTDFVNSTSLISHGLGLAWSIPDNFLMRASIAWRGSYTPVADPDPRRRRLYFSLNKTL
jgi:hemolysin activation/secretion protein